MLDKISNSFAFSVGKSTIINTMRALKPSDSGAATVNIIECTNTVNEYPDPKNPNVIYYDFPGVGTSKFPRDKYFENIKKVTKDEIDIKQYDFFMIISADRFTENDLWLAKELERMEKPFYFIRTKIDRSLEDRKRDYPKDYDEKNTLQEIRHNCHIQLEGILNRSILKVFLISGRLDCTDKWDFRLMMTSLVKDLPFIQRNAIIRSIYNFSKETIKQKADLLRNEVWKMAMASGFCGAIPIPFFSALPDYYITKTYTAYFKATLGLDEESLKKIAKMHGRSFKELLEYMLSSPWSQFFQHSLVSSATAASLARDATQQAFTSAAGESIKTATEESIKIATEQGFIEITTNAIKTSGFPRMSGCTGVSIPTCVWEAGSRFPMGSVYGIGTESVNTIAKQSVYRIGTESVNTIAKESVNTIAKESVNTIAKESAVTMTDFIPVVGSIFGGTVNYYSMKYRLNKLINDMEQAAYAVLDFVTNLATDGVSLISYLENLF